MCKPFCVFLLRSKKSHPCVIQGWGNSCSTVPPCLHRRRDAARWPINAGHTSSLSEAAPGWSAAAVTPVSLSAGEETSLGRSLRRKSLLRHFTHYVSMIARFCGLVKRISLQNCPVSNLHNICACLLIYRKFCE